MCAISDVSACDYDPHESFRFCVQEAAIQRNRDAANCSFRSRLQRIFQARREVAPTTAVRASTHRTQLTQHGNIVEVAAVGSRPWTCNTYAFDGPHYDPHGAQKVSLQLCRSFSTEAYPV